MRAFLAIPIPSDHRATLAGEATKLARHPRDIRPVPADNLHLTLVFLGEIASNMVDILRSGMEAASRRHRPFIIGFGGGGTFPLRGEPRVVWAGVDGDLTAITSLQVSVADEMRKIGLRVDQRSFSPHVTLARVNRRATPSARIAIARRVGDLEFDSLGQFEVSAISLMESDLSPEGAIHREMLQVELGNGEQTELRRRRFRLFGRLGG